MSANVAGSSTLAGDRFRLGNRPALDGLRAVAIALVLVYHASIHLIGFGWLPGGFDGVDVFFALSGFLIGSLLMEEHDDTGRLALPSFYIRRARRLFPGLYAMIIVAFGLWVFFPALQVNMPLHRELIGLGGAVGYFYNWLPLVLQGRWMWGVTQVWSLGVEEQFYFVFPFLLLILLRLRRPRLTTAALFGISVLSAIACTAVFAATNNHDLVWTSPTTRLFELLLGATMAHLLRRGWQPGRWVPWATIGGLGFIAYFSATQQSRSTFMFYGGYLLLSLSSCAVILGVLREGWLTRLLSLAPLKFVGRISYSLYLWHFVIFLFVQQELPRHSERWERLAVGIGVAFLAAVASHYFIERPFLKPRTSLGTQRQPETLAAGVVGP